MIIGSPGTVVRATAAVVLTAAVLVRIRIYPTLGIHPDEQKRRNTGMRRFAMVLGCLFSLMWAVLALVRIRYPYELEWSGGAMLDHCHQVLRGLPLYVPPGSSWFPFEYPPVYFWASAVVMRLIHDDGAVGMRIVSCASTVGCLIVVWLWLRLLTARVGNQYWPLLAPGLFLAAYRFTGAWYDIERLDMLFMFLSVLGGYLLSCGLHKGATVSADKLPPSRGISFTQTEFTLLSAAVFCVAFLTKQQAVLFAIGAAGALIVMGNWRQFLLFCTASVIFDYWAVHVIDASTHGWFAYYCFHVPLANGIRKELALQFLLVDMPLVAPAIGLCIVAALAFKVKLTDAIHKIRTEPCVALFLSQVLMALAGSFLSRAHWGGAENVLIAGYLFVMMAACLCASRLEETGKIPGAPLYLLAICQMAVLTYRPDLQLPRAANYAAGSRYSALISELKKEGEVLCVDHGGFTSPAHFHLMAVTDVFGSEKKTPPSIEAAIRYHRYASIVTDALPDAEGPLGSLLKEYPSVQRVGIAETWIITGFPTPSPARPVYVMRPAKAGINTPVVSPVGQ